jgi:hypothetical protein
MGKTIERMKERWGVGPLGVVAILLCFSLAGSSVVFLRGPVLGFLLPPHAPTWLRVVLYLLVVVPLYQLLLLGYGALLGQFRFFWDRERKLVRLLFRWVTRRWSG